ncbi:NUDIX hydrolase, partial [Candidatus Uhrbacteria bacterium]|nr:NUDIX hydrolase [Candidatus Uhrbacteria bacterium]
MSTIPEFGMTRENEERRDGGCGVVFDPASQRYAVGKMENGCYILFSGGVHDGEDMRAGILREVTEESGLYDFLHIEKIGEVITHYRNSAKQVNRLAHATCFLIILRSTDARPVAHEAHEKFSLVWATADD